MSYNKWEDIEHKMTDVYHSPNPDAKLKPKLFYCVVGVRKADAEYRRDAKPCKVSATFDNKDMAMTALKGLLGAKFDKAEMWVSGKVEWGKFVPETKGDVAMWEKIHGG
jgi:hypothetical protein